MSIGGGRISNIGGYMAFTSIKISNIAAVTHRQVRSQICLKVITKKDIGLFHFHINQRKELQWPLLIILS